MKEKDFDHIVKQKLEAINEAPPAYMWDRVAAGMASQGAATSGLSKLMKVVLVAASIIFIAGLAVIFSNQSSSHKRHARKHNDKLWHKQQRIKTHQAHAGFATNAISPASNTEYPNTERTHTPKNQQTIHSPSKVASSITRKTTVGVKTSTKQNAMVNNQMDEFPPLPTATEIRKAGSITSASANNQTNKSTKNEATKEINVNYEVATVAPTKPASQQIQKKNTEQKETPLNTEKTVTINTQQASSKTVSTEEESETENNQDISSAVEQVKVITGDLPNDVQAEAEESSTKQQDPKNRIFSKYGLGIHYGPEFMTVDSYKFTDHAVDLSFNYQNLNFIVQTGIGVRFSKDQATYNMKYKRWEYWKTQIRFDSASMYIGPNGDTIFQPSNEYYVDIYDSLNHSYQATAKQHYTIIQIPILIGYQFDYDKFALFVKGGIRYSVIAYEQTDELFLPDENSRITDYNFPIKTRAKSNIDYELSLGGAYKITNHFQIQAEAFGRYYHYSIYEENPPSGIHPWSYSVRAGLVYLF